MQYMLNFMSETLNMDITAFQQQFFSHAMRGINSKAPETDLFSSYSIFREQIDFEKLMNEFYFHSSTEELESSPSSSEEIWPNVLRRPPHGKPRVF
jgi:hypothetical protein